MLYAWIFNIKYSCVIHYKSHRTNNSSNSINRIDKACLRYRLALASALIFIAIPNAIPFSAIDDWVISA